MRLPLLLVLKIFSISMSPIISVPREVAKVTCYLAVLFGDISMFLDIVKAFATFAQEIAKGHAQGQELSSRGRVQNAADKADVR